MRSADLLGWDMPSPVDDEPPPQRGLWLFSFSMHVARGVLRDQTMRRKAMFWTVVVAAVMLFLGATVLAPMLDPQAHPGWFILYWLACAWLTITVVLLAAFDLLLVRARGRNQRRALANKLIRPDSPNDGD
jgi:hypothetical protein